MFEPNELEQKYINAYIHLTELRKLLEEDIDKIFTLPFKIPEVYDNVLNDFLDIVLKDIKNIKMWLVKNQIKIQEFADDGEFVEYRILVRNYEFVRRYWKIVFINRGHQILNCYLGKPFSKEMVGGSDFLELLKKGKFT